jgi:uncharacterized protein DUF5648/N,N-dimethylformamidase beta subunit-like protein
MKTKEIQSIFFLFLLSVLAFAACSQINVHADSNIVPLYRLYSKSYTDHMYTTNSSEADLYASSGGYVKQGIAGYVYSSQVAGTVPLYRLYNLNEIDHFYTADVKERNSAIDYSGYADEGIAGYVYLLHPMPSTTNSAPSVSPQIYTLEDRVNLPQWIKNTAKWWGDGKITSEKFSTAISFLGKAQFITTPISQTNTADKIPNWVRNVAFFWATNEISDNEFIGAIKYLLQTNAIKISKQTLDKIDTEGLRKVNYQGYSPLFSTFAYARDFVFVNGKSIPLFVYFDLKPELKDIYTQIAIWDKPHSAAVVVPLFTSTAYWEPGFYDYYRGDCNTSCLTKRVEFDRSSTFSGSHNGIAVLKLLGYDTITDADIDENPQILKQYDKLIILHNEYVTKKEFDAITHHPKVVYLYANPLYAEVSYHNDTLTLIRGHGYPTPDIRNAFGWEFDNSKYEYNTDCSHTSFYKVDNGIMQDCYPENIIFTNMTLLKFIKDY